MLSQPKIHRNLLIHQLLSLEQFHHIHHQNKRNNILDLVRLVRKSLLVQVLCIQVFLQHFEKNELRKLLQTKTFEHHKVLITIMYKIENSENDQIIRF